MAAMSDGAVPASAEPPPRPAGSGSGSGAGNLAARLEHHSDHPALHLDEGPLTHRELAERVARCRGGLVAAGVKPGRRVAIVAGNEVGFVAGHLAALGLGAVSVPLNPQCPPSELARELAAAAIDVVVSTDRADATVDQAMQQLSVEWPDTTTPVRVAVGDLERADPVPITDVDDHHPATLLFTSGTSGLPRPAILTHRNLTAALESILTLPTGLTDHAQTFLGVVPLFHVLGLNTVLHLSLALEGSIVLGEFAGGPATVDSIERHQVTVALGPPNLWQVLSGTAGVNPAQFASVELAVSGAAPLPAPVGLDVAARLGLHLDEGYGLTESAAIAATTATIDAPPGSIGRLVPGVEARIVDAHGADCLVGDPGELWLRGDMIFPGYWTPDGPDRAPLSDDGWLVTGDLAAVDDDGLLAIVGRSKDLIIVSGFNVHPGEVEVALGRHPSVADVGVVGEPSPTTGEAIVAFVVPAAGQSVDDEELRAFCRTELARFKVPSRIVVASDLPIGPTGKLQRRQLR